jgi:hypothetical protein
VNVSNLRIHSTLKGTLFTMNIGKNFSQPLAAQKLRAFTSPPSTQPKVEAPTVQTDTVTFSSAKAKSGPGLSTMKKVGIGLALTAAVGGAFVAGVSMSQPEEPPSFESRLEDFGKKLDRGWEDAQIDLQRGAEDFETGFNRGYEDAQSPNTKGRQAERDFEDNAKKWERKTDDFKRDLGRKWNDFWDN